MAKKPVVAGGGASTTDPKRAGYAYSDKSYTPAEDINQGPNGAPAKKVAPGHGQGSDDTAAKNKLVDYSIGQKDPYRAMASEFPVSEVNEAHGQDEGGGAATWENKSGGGKNQLAEYNVFQEGPRRAESGGMTKGSGEPIPGDRASVVARMFPIKQNDGESNLDGGQTGIAESLDLQTGYVACSSGSQSRVKEVPQYNVTIAPPLGKDPKRGLVANN